MIKLINKIINSKIFLKKPIILIHIGSDGSNFSIWKKIASNSILISVDPSMTNEQNKTFYVNKRKKMNISYNCTFF